MTLTLDQLKHGSFTGCLFGSTVPPGMTLTQREQQLGHTYDVQHSYNGGDMGGTPNTPAAGHLLAATISSGVHATGDWISQVNSGKLDSNIKAYSAKITKPTFVILWQEFNGGWESTSHDPAADFVRAWRHVATIFAANPNIIRCWSPNVYAFGVADPENHYPGADVVDWVAFDGYCHGSYHTFDQIFAKAISHYGPNGTRHKHPFMVGETAAQKTLKPDQYVQSVHQSLLSGAGKGTVKALLWFDNAWGTNGYQVDATTAELAAYKKLIADPALRAA
jgi:hypothetical protein